LVLRFFPEAFFFIFRRMRKFIPLLALSLFMLGCSERTERIEQKLESYLQEDLKFMVAQTIHASGNKDALLAEPYYRVKDFRLFEGAAAEVYSAYAEVNFYIYKDIAMYEQRKYRYDVEGRHWDRYLKVLHFGRDSLP